MSRNTASGGKPWSTGRFEHAMRKRSWLRYLPWGVLALTLAGSWQLWRSAEDSAINSRQGEFNLRVQDVESRLRRRMGEYEQVLFALHGFIASQRVVHPGEFRRYMNSLHLENRLPGIKSVIFIPSRGAEGAAGRADFIWRRSTHAYSNLAQLALRQVQANLHSPDSATVAPSLMLVRSSGTAAQPDYLMVLPVYKTGSRHTDLAGWLAAPVEMQDVMKNLFNDKAEQLDIELYDAAAPGNPLLYRSYVNSFATPAGTPLFHASARLDLEGRALRMAAHSRPSFDAGVDMARARLIALTAFLLSIVLGLISAMLVRDRSRAMSMAEGANSELRRNKAFQAALQESEERYRNIFNNAQDLIYTLDTGNRFTSASDFFCQTTGYARDEVIGKHLGSILTPEGLKKALETNARKLRGDPENSRDELDIICKDGHVITAEINTTLFYQDGKRSGTMGIARDITSRRAMEQLLLESEQKYRDLFEFAQEFALTTNMELRITSVNRMVVDVLGYSAGEMIGRSIGDFISSASMDMAREMIASKVSGASQVTRYGVELLARNGRVIQSEFTTRLIYHGGKATGIHAVGYDISERLRYEQALRDSEERYRSIFNNAQDLIFTIDMDNRFTSVSDFFCKTTGYSREEAVGMNISKLLTGRNLEITRQMTASKLRGEVGVTRYELDATTKDGRTITVEMNTTLFYKGGKIAGIQGIGRDITEQRKIEQELRENEERTRQIYNNTQDFVFAVDPDMNLTFITDSFCQMTSYTAEEIIGQPISKLMTPASMEMSRQMIAAKSEGKRFVTRYEIDVVTRDGGIIPVELNSYLAYKNGKPAGSHGTGRDITERRNYEKALRDSEEKYREFFEFANDFAYSTDLDGNFLAANQSLLAATGYDRLVGENISKLLTADQLALARQMTGDKLQGQANITRYELMLTTKTGSQIPIELVSTLVYRDGKPIGVQGIGRDISVRRRAEEMLRRSERNYRELMEQAAEAIFVADNTGHHYVDANQAACDLLGYSHVELLGKEFRSIFHPEDITQDPIKFEEMWSGAIIHTRRRFLRKDGSYIPVELSARMLSDGRLQALARDISGWIQRENELREANALAEAASRAKSEFLANMSHEIRTPMNSVLGMARLALAREADTRQIGYLEKILMSGEHLLGIIDDILDFSKIEAGKLQIENTAFDMRAITESVNTLMTDKAIAKGLELKVELDPALPAELRGDPLRLRQVLLNFVDNAIKFTSLGGVRVSIGREQCAGPECAVLFEVTDTGIGMNAVEMAMLFRPFQQSDGSVTRKYGGTGLGLSISKRLVELMGGEAGVESQPGRGSKFWFRVRLEQSDRAARPDAPRSGKQDTQTAIRNARILLAENNTFNQQVAREFLEIAGCQVQVASNGLEVLDMLQREHFDCILMDVQMPQMDGLEATRRIRAHHAFATLPVIAVTANALAEERQRCIEAGMNDFITKPLRPEMLYGVLAKWLSRQVKPLIMPDSTRKPARLALPRSANLDFSVLAELVGGQRERMREMANRFMQSAREDMDKVQIALERSDIAQLQAMGHHIKSPAAMVGAADFAELCRALEANRDDLERARDLVGRMSGMLAQIEEEIATHFS